MFSPLKIFNEVVTALPIITLSKSSQCQLETPALTPSPCPLNFFRGECQQRSENITRCKAQARLSCGNNVFFSSTKTTTRSPGNIANWRNVFNLGTRIELLSYCRRDMYKQANGLISLNFVLPCFISPGLSVCCSGCIRVQYPWPPHYSDA